MELLDDSWEVQIEALPIVHLLRVHCQLGGHCLPVVGAM